MKYIDAEKLIAEIERRLQENADKALVFGAAFAGRTAEDNDLKNIITSLQQEQPDVDLEKIIRQTYHDGSVADTSDMDHVDYENIARHFYELGKLNARKEE